MATVEERLDKIRGLANLSSYNEEQAKTAIIIPVLESLGWETDNRDQVVPELPLKPIGKEESQNHVDYCLRISGANEVFIEAKRPGVNLSKWEGELLRYVSAYSVPLAVLTTGLEWWLYLPLKKGAWQEKRFAVIDVHKDYDAANQLTAFLSRRTILDGSAFQSAEKAIIDENLPRVWNELYKEQRNSLVESLGRKLRDQTGYEPQRQHLEYFLDRQVGVSSSLPPPPTATLPVSIIPLLEEIRQAATGPSCPKAEWYATQTPDYRAKVVLNDDLSRVFVRVTWAKDWVWVNLRDVGKYKVSKAGELDKLRDQIQVAYQKAIQHLQHTE